MLNIYVHSQIPFNFIFNTVYIMYVRMYIFLILDYA